MNTWPRKPISSVVDAVIDYRGRTPPRSVSGIPTISAKHVKRGRVEHCGERFVSQQTYDQWTTRGLIKPGDVLITTEAPVGEVALVPSDQTYLITRRVIAMQFDPARACERFVMYSLLADPHRKALGNLGHGATVPRVFKKDILDFEIPMPGVGTQRRVGSVLGAFDDLMENNRRRIEILEEMARLLYREWFVHFRFPGHEDVELVDSDLGPIPKGWEAGEFSDLVSEVSRTVDPEEIADGTPVLGLEHLPRRSTTLSDWESAFDVGSRRKVFNEGDILFGKIRPYFHKVVDAPISGCSSTDAIVFRPMEAILRSRTLAIASSDEFVGVATATSNGTKMPRANTTILMSYSVPHPTHDVEMAFSETVGPMNYLRKNLATQNRLLREARDLLLPRLVSGELDVSELDLGLERVGA